MTSHFRRGKSKVYYNSEVWDPGAGGNGLHSKPSESEEDLARTSFRSIRGDISEHETSIRDDQSRYNKYSRIFHLHGFRFINSSVYIVFDKFMIRF